LHVTGYRDQVTLMPLECAPQNKHPSLPTRHQDSDPCIHPTIDKFTLSKHTLILSWELIPNQTTIVSDQRFTRTHWLCDQRHHQEKTGFL
jgi:hypothetical protein